MAPSPLVGYGDEDRAILLREEDSSSGSEHSDQSELDGVALAREDREVEDDMADES